MTRKILFVLLLGQTAGYAPGQEALLLDPDGDRRLGFAYQLLSGMTGSYLGVHVAEIDSTRAKELKLKEERGVELKRVEADSPAEKAGLKERDVVLEYNGQPIEGTESFIRLVRETPVGRSVKMVISREGATQTLTATIGQRKAAEPRRYSFTIPPIPPMPPIDVPRAQVTVRTTRIGIETESLSDQLAEFFGVKNGVLVRSVDRDSPADRAGLKAGDVLTRVDSDPVSRPSEVSSALRSSWDKKSVPLLVVRNKKEMTLTLELPERASRDTPRRAITIRDRI